MNKYRRQLIFYVVGIISLGFIGLCILVLIFPHSFIDTEFSSEVQEHQSPALDSLMKWISWPGYMPRSMILVVTAAAFFYFSKYKKEAFYILLTLLSGIVGALIKIAINRPRPAAPIVSIIEITKGQSFPSGHVLFYVVFFGFLTVLMVHLKSIAKKIRIPLAILSIVFIFSIPFSRVYLGAHWFTDVVVHLRQYPKQEASKR